MCFHNFQSQSLTITVSGMKVFLQGGGSDKAIIAVRQAFLKCLFALMTLANLHHFLIYILAFFTSALFGWFISTYLSHFVLGE